MSDDFPLRNGDELTLEKLKAAIDAAMPPIYYMTTETLPQDVMYYFAETKTHPECLIFHPKKLDYVRQMLSARSSRPLVDLKDELHEKMIARLISLLEPESQWLKNSYMMPKLLFYFCS